MSNVLSAEETQQLLALPECPLRVRLIKEHNHIYRIETNDDTFYLKTYTKDWYGDDRAATAGCVQHEMAAWNCMAAHGLAVPEVVAYDFGCDSAVGGPYLVTRALAGESLTSLLETADPPTFAALLAATGAYVRQMHNITFRHPGYIMSLDGPDAPPAADAWQHPIWSAAGTQQSAEAMLKSDRSRIAPATAAELQQRFATMARDLAPACTPLRFVHGDCHASQFFLVRDGALWHVTGVVDMEVASAGDCVHDWLKCGIELACTLAPQTRWWEPLFAGYGGAPDFELFRLRLLGWNEINFTCYGAERWPVSRQHTLERLLRARTWQELFMSNVP